MFILQFAQQTLLERDDDINFMIVFVLFHHYFDDVAGPGVDPSWGMKLNIMRGVKIKILKKSMHACYNKQKITLLVMYSGDPKVHIYFFTVHYVCDAHFQRTKLKVGKCYYITNTYLRKNPLVELTHNMLTHGELFLSP